MTFIFDAFSKEILMKCKISFNRENAQSENVFESFFTHLNYLHGRRKVWTSRGSIIFSLDPPPGWNRVAGLPKSGNSWSPPPPGSEGLFYGLPHLFLFRFVQNIQFHSFRYSSFLYFKDFFCEFTDFEKAAFSHRIINHKSNNTYVKLSAIRIYH